jgi:hypothetical protein
MRTILLFALAISVSLHAEEAKKDVIRKEDKEKISAAAESVSGETKRILRKIGRTSMDATCTLTKTKEACEKEKAEHKALTKKEEVEGVPGN